VPATVQAGSLKHGVPLLHPGLQGQTPAEHATAIAALGAIKEATTGSATIEANPTLRITSRRDIPSNRLFGASDKSLSLANWSSAKQTKSSFTGALNSFDNLCDMSSTEFSPLHARQMNAEVLFRQNALLSSTL
jgi:hypothetical protein